MSHFARTFAAVITVALITACGPSGRSSQPTTAAPRTSEISSPFRPGRASHSETVEDMTRTAARVLAATFAMAPTAASGAVTTEWTSHDSEQSPGRTRVAIEITRNEVIVRFECQSCTAEMPEASRLAEQAQTIANAIVAASRPSGAERILAKMRDFKDQACACSDPQCIEEVETEMMRWALANMDEMKSLEPTPAQDAEADRIAEAMDTCRARHEPAKSQGSGTPATPAAHGSTGSPECDEYLSTFDAIVVKCRDKLGPALEALLQSRAAQGAAFAEWAQLDEASRRAALDAAKAGCSAATDALRQSAGAMGCAL